MSPVKKPASIPPPPSPLGTDGQRLWDKLHSEFELSDQHHLELLFLACVQTDRAAAAREAVNKHGVLIRDRWEQLKPNPAVEQERQASNAARLLLRELGLDHATGNSDARPPRLGGQRH